MNTSTALSAHQDHCVLTPLDGHWAVLTITGSDSAKFMQGQLTCNLTTITLNQAAFGAHCTPKGRMIANFYLWQHAADAYRLLLPAATLPALQKNLGKYIVFSKAKLHDACDELSVLGVSGNGALAALQAQLPELRAERHASTSNEILSAVCVEAESSPRFLCTVARQHLATVTAKLAGMEEVITEPTLWAARDIDAGLGFVQQETIEAFIPQMLNMQLLDGISFNKGCYTGQEIVARMQYRGSLKKAMYRVQGHGAAPTANSDILLADNPQPVGNVVNAVACEDGYRALAVINHDAITQPLLIDEHSIQVLDLPYAVQPSVTD